MGFPKQAIQFCLDMGDVKAEDLDQVAFSTQSLPIHYLRIKREFNFTIRDWLNEQEEYWKPLLFENKTNKKYLKRVHNDCRFEDVKGVNDYYDFSDVPDEVTDKENKEFLYEIRLNALSRFFDIPREKVNVYNHHMSHQYYAYFASPFRDKPCLVFTSDGGGDGCNGTLSIAVDNKIKEISRNNNTDLGRIYRYITLILGMKIGEHEYKVMGLSPYSSEYEINKTDKVFKDVFHVPDDMIEYKNKPKDLFFHFRDGLADCRFDGIAGGAQRLMEDVGSEWFSKALKKHDISRVVFSGGLSMNVKLNKTIAELDAVDEFYCAASGGDESVALGACYLATSLEFQKIKSVKVIDNFRDVYKGPSLNQKQIDLAVNGLSGYVIIKGVTNRRVAEYLAEGLIIGRMCGNMEFGARALGNRSIIANPSSIETVKRINEKIKFRDFWMPFAPSVLDCFVDEYLVNPKNLSGDHMTGSFDTTEKGQKALVAAMHPADKTVRAHIVTKEINPGYHDLITEFSKISQVGAVLNTSFNLHGLPIVAYPEHAIHVLENSQLDGILMNDTLVLRK
jgi:carbamoyltransferase